MFVGTGSDVGKSMIATGLCRIFRQDGYAPAPFKAQNMALNSYATPDGKEIGRAQAVQAEAAGLECTTDMNPILLKPSGELRSQVIVNGRPYGNTDAKTYFSTDGKDFLCDVAHLAYDRLSQQYNPIVMEGAGSISELNLRKRDIVNMSMAAYADAKVILVADIDRGGVFASAYGSIMLQSEEDRRRIKGIIINKFRGDMSLFKSGRRLMEEICGVPVIGVVPYMDDVYIEEEDSVALKIKNKTGNGEGKVRIAVVLLKHISNYTDFDMLERMPDVRLYYAVNPEDISEADIVIIPGTKSTIDDLYHIRKSGMAQAVVKAYEEGKTVIGICGGYQMMGVEVSDPHNVEGDIRFLPGLGILPVKTEITSDKTTRQINFRFMNGDCINKGYEIHAGTTLPVGECHAVNILEDGSAEGCMVGERCFGTYLHGILDNKEVIDYLLRPYMKDSAESEAEDYREFKERQYDLLADRIREYVDIPQLYDIISR